MHLQAIDSFSLRDLVQEVQVLYQRQEHSFESPYFDFSTVSLRHLSDHDYHIKSCYSALPI